MQKELIIEKLKEKGCRITKQRSTLLDIILEHECSSCKEIYYKASGVDETIGAATVYRMVNILEEIGAISRKNMYKVVYSETCPMEEACTVVLDDETTYQLSAKTGTQWFRPALPPADTWTVRKYPPSLSDLVIVKTLTASDI